MPQNLDIRRAISIGIIFAFLANTFGPFPIAWADSAFGGAGELYLPKSALIMPSTDVVVKGMTIHPENPLQFDLIVEPSHGVMASAAKQSLKDESLKMIKYFLASLTIPEKDMWVNLSPYEKDHIIPNAFGQTLMGRDLLAQDYILKQITASLIHPDTELGREFWSKIYAQAQAKFGTTNIPINTFNKVWIMPDKATVWEHGNSVFVVERHLKVMLEEDYLALQKHSSGVIARSEVTKLSNDTHALGSQTIRELIIPALEKEVNEDNSFAQLRQIYNAMILATWFKKRMKESFLGTVYTDKNKVNGIEFGHGMNKQDIYEQYLRAFKKGAFNFIKEEPDPATGEIIPRKYFSGGMVGLDSAMLGISAARLFDLPRSFKDALPKNPLRIVFNLFTPSTIFNERNPAIQQIREMYGDVTSFKKDAEIVKEEVGTPIDSYKAQWYLTAWYSKAFASKEPIEPMIALTHPTLQTVQHDVLPPKQMILTKPDFTLQPLMDEWEKNKYGLKVRFEREWRELCQHHVPGFIILSQDEQGKFHLEGWIGFQEFPGLGMYLSYLEIAPWNQGSFSKTFKGVGSLLVAKSMEESFRRGYGGKVFFYSGSKLFSDLGARHEDGYRNEDTNILPFYRFTSQTAYQVISNQNYLNGNVQVKDLTKFTIVLNDKAMRASYQNFFPYAKIMKEDHFVYDLAINKHIGDRKRGVVLYLGSGVDLSHAILTTNGAEFDMLDGLVPLYDEFKSYVDSKWDDPQEVNAQNVYISDKRLAGYGPYPRIHDNFNACLVAELKSLGITRDQLKVQRLNRGFRIIFEKQFPGEDKLQTYTFNFILGEVGRFLPKKKYDILFQRAGWRNSKLFPFNHLIANIDPHMKNGAFVIINPYDYKQRGEMEANLGSQGVGRYHLITFPSSTITLENSLAEYYKRKGFGFRLRIFHKDDKAMQSSLSTAKDLGGIDMNSNLLNLTIKRDTQGMLLPASQQNWAHLSINGFTPVIIKIEKVNLSELIGIN